MTDKLKNSLTINVKIKNGSEIVFLAGIGAAKNKFSNHKVNKR